jgi:hypothetical protein
VRALPLLLVLPLLTACSSASKSAQIRTTTTSANDFVAAANKVCIASDRRIFKIGRLTRDPKGWAKTFASAKVALADMQALHPPPDRAAAFKRMVRFGRALALSIEEIHDSLAKRDLDTAGAAWLAAGRFQDEVHRAAKAAGLTFCQQPLTNWPA